MRPMRRGMGRPPRATFAPVSIRAQSRSPKWSEKGHADPKVVRQAVRLQQRGKPMRRLFFRRNLKRLIVVGTLLVCASAAAAAAPETRLTLPQSGPVRVAFVVSDGA